MSEWGRDHWSAFGYCLSCYVGSNGMVDVHKLREDGGRYPTRLREGRTEPNHNDFDCIADLEKEGLLENIGTGCNILIHITDKGWKVGRVFAEHLFRTRSTGSFVYDGE